MLTLTQHPFKIVQYRVILLASCLLCCLMFSPLSQPAGYCLNCVRTNDHTRLESSEYGNEQLGASNCASSIDEQQDSNQLAIELFLHAAHQRAEGNLVISPHSFFQALHILMLGADGATLQLLQQLLGFQGELAAAAEQAPDEILVHSSDVLMANMLEINDNYIDQVQDMHVQIHSGIDFTDQSSLIELAKRLNKDLKRLTNGVLDSLFDGKNWTPDTLLQIVTTIYFHGTWHTPLDGNESGAFTLHPGQEIILDKFLTKNLKSTQYAELNSWQAVSVPYEGDYEMVLILPPSGVLPSSASAGFIIKLLASLRSQCVILGLPPFKITSNHNLKPFLQAHKAGDIFVGGLLDMGNMLGNAPENLCLSHLGQYCSIDVNEQGTTAVAVAGAECIVERGGRIEKFVKVYFDRPSMYILRQKSSGRILFIGQLMDPRNT